MNEIHEQNVIPAALAQLKEDIEVRSQGSSMLCGVKSLYQNIQDIMPDPERSEHKPLHQRKLEYIHPSDGSEPRSPTTVGFSLIYLPYVDKALLGHKNYISVSRPKSCS